MTTRAILVVGLLALPVMFSGHAVAQQIDTGASSQSVSQTQVIVGGGGSGSGRNEVDYSGGYSVKSAPDVVAPMLPGGANPCVVGMSAGGSVVGFGMAAGGSWNDVDCERRNLSIVLLNASKQFEDPSLMVAGIEILCNNREVAEALQVAGRPCAADRTSRPQSASFSSDPDLTATSVASSRPDSDFGWIESSNVGR